MSHPTATSPAEPTGPDGTGAQVTALAGRLDDTEARLTAAVHRLAEIDAAIAAAVFDDDTPAMPADDPDGDGSGDGSGPAPAELYYPNLGRFVEEYLVVVFGRPAGGNYRWCARWWDHLEAFSRLEALWRAWEHLRLDPRTGIAVWLRDYLDPTLARLLAHDGPFARCSPPTRDRPGGEHTGDSSLPVAPVPHGYLDG